MKAKAISTLPLQLKKTYFESALTPIKMFSVHSVRQREPIETIDMFDATFSEPEKSTETAKLENVSLSLTT